MGTERKTEPAKRQPPASPEVGRKGDGQLSQEELERISGGGYGKPLNPQPLPP